MRLTKDQINEYKQVILSGISAEDYNGKELLTDKDKIQFVLNCFNSEYYKWQSHKNIQSVFTEYLQGLPSCLHIPFTNYDILQLAEKINKTEYKTDRQQCKIIENYFSFMANIFFKMVRQYKIEI
jgi:hypothetical protein